MSDNEGDRNLITYCGLYCGDCFSHQGKIVDLARDLKKELRQSKFDKTAESLSTISFFKDGFTARIPGNGIIEGRENLCSLSAITDMLLRGNAFKILKPKRGSAPEHEL